MDNPTSEIEQVIRLLTQSTPAIQRATIEKYFTKDASFTHPFCRTGSFNNSRSLIIAIYRWYKMMSPKIDIDIHSTAYDAQTQTLYVQISQTFRLWFIPWYASHVHLTAVLTLARSEATHKYQITSQTDLYQVNEFVKFYWFSGSWTLWLLQFLAALICWLGTVVFAPVAWSEEKGGLIARVVEILQPKGQGDSSKEKLLVPEKRIGDLLTAPALEQR